MIKLYLEGAEKPQFKEIFEDKIKGELMSEIIIDGNQIILFDYNDHEWHYDVHWNQLTADPIKGRIKGAINTFQQMSDPEKVAIKFVHLTLVGIKNEVSGDQFVQACSQIMYIDLDVKVISNYVTKGYVYRGKVEEENAVIDYSFEDITKSIIKAKRSEASKNMIS